MMKYSQVELWMKKNKIVGSCGKRCRGSVARERWRKREKGKEERDEKRTEEAGR